MDSNAVINYLGVWGVLALMFAGAVRWIWPKIEAMSDKKNAMKQKEIDVKREEHAIRRKEQEHTKEIIEAVKVTNQLVDQNNQAFAAHNAVFGLYLDIIKELRDHQRGIKMDLHRRFDTVEDKLDGHDKTTIKIEEELKAILANLRRLHGSEAFPEGGESHENGRD